jgi:hypothetical protein
MQKIYNLNDTLRELTSCNTNYYMKELNNKSIFTLKEMLLKEPEYFFRFTLTKQKKIINDLISTPEGKETVMASLNPKIISPYYFFNIKYVLPYPETLKENNNIELICEESIFWLDLNTSILRHLFKYVLYPYRYTENITIGELTKIPKHYLLDNVLYIGQDSINKIQASLNKFGLSIYDF